MKHLVAGLAVAGIAACVVLGVALIHAVLLTVMGEPLAFYATGLIIVAGCAAVILDIITERRPSK